MKKMSKTPVPVAKIKALKPQQTKEPMPPKGASLKSKSIAKKSPSQMKAETKKAVGSVNAYRKKLDDKETKALRNRKRAAAGTLGAMVAGGLAMFRENKRREK